MNHILHNGLRVTDEANDDGMLYKMVLAGKVNKGLVADLTDLGGSCWPCGVDGIIWTKFINKTKNLVGVGHILILRIRVLFMT